MQVRIDRLFGREDRAKRERRYKYVVGKRGDVYAKRGFKAGEEVYMPRKKKVYCEKRGGLSQEML